MNQSFDLHRDQTVRVFSSVESQHLPQDEVFARQREVPGHASDHSLSNKCVAVVGVGGIGCSVMLALARSGVGRLIAIDDDLVDGSNLARQVLLAPHDIETPKAFAAARNLVSTCASKIEVAGINRRLEEVEDSELQEADCWVVGIDNNWGRQEACTRARRAGVPAVFAMLSQDGMRFNCFLQGAEPGSPCLWCALPHLDPDKAMPCAAAILTTCLVIGGVAAFFAHRAILGWPKGVKPFNWREGDLLARTPDRAGRVAKVVNCRMCAYFK
jgi:molybdopterin/thiamine biosynthesis adenylyltransferase